MHCHDYEAVPFAILFTNTKYFNSRFRGSDDINTSFNSRYFNCASMFNMSLYLVDSPCHPNFMYFNVCYHNLLYNTNTYPWWYSFTRLYCTVGWHGTKHTLWLHDMDTPSAEAIHQSPLTGRYLSQTSLMQSFRFYDSLSCWTNGWFAGDQRHQDAHVTSL